MKTFQQKSLGKNPLTSYLLLLGLSHDYCDSICKIFENFGLEFDRDTKNPITEFGNIGVVFIQCQSSWVPFTRTYQSNTN